MDKLTHWLERPSTQNFVIAVIILNAITLGLETSPAIMDRFGAIVGLIDTMCLSIFVVELLLKLIAYRLRFFRDGWRIFDFVIVGIALIPGSGTFSVLRALRILRVLRVISVAPSLRRVVEGFVQALPGMGSVFLLMGIIFYIGAVMATKLFGHSCVACSPENAALFEEWFGTIGRSGYSLFQIMTLESWSMGIVRPIMQEFPYAWAFFVPFIMVTTFAVVNLLVGLIVNSMQEAAEGEKAVERDRFQDEVLSRLSAIERRLPPKSD